MFICVKYHDNNINISNNISISIKIVDFFLCNIFNTLIDVGNFLIDFSIDIDILFDVLTLFIDI
jgi:hypothetical protein